MQETPPVEFDFEEGLGRVSRADSSPRKELGRVPLAAASPLRAETEPRPPENEAEASDGDREAEEPAWRSPRNVHEEEAARETEASDGDSEVRSEARLLMNEPSETEEDECVFRGPTPAVHPICTAKRLESGNLRGTAAIVGVVVLVIALSYALVLPVLVKAGATWASDALRTSCTVLAPLAMLCLGACLVLDPGPVRGNAANLELAHATECKVCRELGPPDAYHCRVCNRCVAGFDHHCNLLGVCIGSGNVRPYIGLLALGATALCLLVLAGGTAAHWDLTHVKSAGWCIFGKAGEGGTLCLNPWWLLLAIKHGIVLFPLGALAFATTILAVIQLTFFSIGLPFYKIRWQRLHKTLYNAYFGAPYFRLLLHLTFAIGLIFHGIVSIRFSAGWWGGGESGEEHEQSLALATQWCNVLLAAIVPASVCLYKLNLYPHRWLQRWTLDVEPNVWSEEAEDIFLGRKKIYTATQLGFIEAPAFDGPKPGYVYTTGDVGTGYYHDGPPLLEEGESDTERDPRWCKHCEDEKPEGAEHCVACERCVRGRSHHCSLICDCIGDHNRALYMLLMVVVICATLPQVWYAVPPLVTKSLPALLGLYFGAFWSACKWCWSWVPWGLSLFDIVNPPAAVAPIPWLKCFTQLPSFVVSILQLGLLWGDWDLASKSALVFLQQYLFILNARGKLSKRQRHRVQGFFECVGQEDWGRPISGIYESREMYSALAAKEPDTSPSEEEA